MKARIHHCLPHRFPCRRGERGFVLIGAMIFLVILTLLAVSMFRSTGLQERIAGNTRDKQRALEAAQNALQYGEWWLASAGANAPADNCSGTTNANDATQMRVCAVALGASGAQPGAWPATAEYTPTNMSVAAGGGVNSSTQDINYQAKPGVYIAQVATSPDGATRYYQVTASGYGGNPDTTAVVQSTYQLRSTTVSLDGL